MYEFLFITDPKLKYSGANIRINNLAYHFSINDNISYLVSGNILKTYKNKKLVENKKITIFYLLFLIFQNHKFWFCDLLTFSLFPKRNHCFTLHDNKEWTVYARSGIIKKIILKFIILKSKFFFTVTEEQKKILKKIYPNKKIHISYNGISDHWFDNKVTNRFIKKKYVIYVSNFTSHKNHLALRNQKFLIKNYKIILVGRPIDKRGNEIYKELKKYKNIEIHKNISQKLLINLIKYSSFVLFPSNLEGFGIPIIEALSQKKNIILNNKIKFKYLLGCKKIYFHDFRKQIKKDQILNILKKRNCNHCSNFNFLWDNISTKMRNTLRINHKTFS